MSSYAGHAFHCIKNRRQCASHSDTSPVVLMDTWQGVRGPKLAQGPFGPWDPLLPLGRSGSRVGVRSLLMLTKLNHTHTYWTKRYAG